MVYGLLYEACLLFSEARLFNKTGFMTSPTTQEPDIINFISLSAYQMDLK